MLCWRIHLSVRPTFSTRTHIFIQFFIQKVVRPSQEGVQKIRPRSDSVATSLGVRGSIKAVTFLTLSCSRMPEVMADGWMVNVVAMNGGVWTLASA